MRRGEVYWVHFQGTVGSVIRKWRPAVVVSADAASARLDGAQVVPLTSNVQRRYPGEAFVLVGNRRSKALATQIMTVGKSQVFDYEATLSRTDLEALEAALRVQLGL
ncbi:MAG: type II toxin-antitoxin system PemK/MazF family toxin [Chloroflexi bacterium]|nr:type II toxin-antitoxin system PemK/MazF family toxin [Chloroflexota bacterium]